MLKMTRKLLTAIDQVISRTAVIEATVRQRAVDWALAHQIARRSATTIAQHETLKFLNVQRLMTQIGFINVLKHMPTVPPRETLRQVSALLTPSYEETRALQRRVLPYRQIEELGIERAQRLRPEQVRQEVREIALSRTSINLIDQTAFAQLEQWLWTTFPLQAYQILGTLLKQSIAKQWYLERIMGLEDLQKLMLQMYMYAFMEFPLILNILGMKVTPLSMSVLRGRSASIYETFAMQSQDMRTRPYIGTVQARKTETKLIGSERSRQEVAPTKEGIGVTQDLEDDTEVSTGRDLFGKEGFFIAMRYAYSLPFWMRRRLVRNMGMPENHKYARYFGIGCIPTRYAKRSWKYRRYTEESFTHFRRDEYIKMQKRFDKLHKAGVPYKGRYGAGRIWTTR